MTKKDALLYTESHDGIPSDNVTKQTDYFVLGKDFWIDANMRKAESLILNGQDIKIITEDVFFGLLEDYEALSA